MKELIIVILALSIPIKIISTLIYMAYKNNNNIVRKSNV